MGRTSQGVSRRRVTSGTRLMLGLVWFAGSWCSAYGEMAPRESPIDGQALAPGTGRICLSLGVLSRQVSRARAEGSPWPNELARLCGIGYLEGFVVDERGDGDIILVGRRSQARPSLTLDDVVVNLRNISQGGPAPSCSLDPRDQDIVAMEDLFRSARALTTRSESDMLFRILLSSVGPQQAVVGGIPRNSRHARVMIEADYHMKKVSQGHVEVPQVTSYLDHALNDIKRAVVAGAAASAEEGISMARFWFHIAPQAPTFREAKDIVWLDQCPVVVLTEKQRATPSGQLYDVNEDDPTALAFAQDFSRAVPRLTGQVPVYADLENLFRLRALLLAMQHRATLARVGWDFSSFLREYRYQNETPLEPNLPGLANRREWSGTVTRGDQIYQYYLSPMVCGGVGMDMTVEDRTFSTARSTPLARLRKEVSVARPSPDALVWEMSNAPL